MNETIRIILSTLFGILFGAIAGAIRISGFRGIIELVKGSGNAGRRSRRSADSDAGRDVANVGAGLAELSSDVKAIKSGIGNLQNRIDGLQSAISDAGRQSEDVGGSIAETIGNAIGSDDRG